MSKLDADLLHRTAQLAAGWLRSLDGRPVRAVASVAELRSRLGGPLPAAPPIRSRWCRTWPGRRNRDWSRSRPAATSAS